MATNTQLLFIENLLICWKSDLNDMSQCYFQWPDASVYIHLSSDYRMLMILYLFFCSSVLILHALFHAENTLNMLNATS